MKSEEIKTARDIVIVILKGTEYWRKMSKTFWDMYQLSIDMIWNGEY